MRLHPRRAEQSRLGDLAWRGGPTAARGALRCRDHRRGEPGAGGRVLDPTARGQEGGVGG